jgi:antitoxin MazE
MDLQVGKWGNSLAVRLPAQLVRELGVQDGSTLDAEVVSPAHLRLAARKPFDRKAFIKSLEKLHASLPTTEPVVEQMRREARY